MDNSHIYNLSFYDVDEPIKVLSQFSKLEILKLDISKIIEDEFDITYPNLKYVVLTALHIINDSYESLFKNIVLNDNLLSLKIVVRHDVNTYLDMIQLPTNLKMFEVRNPLLTTSTNYTDSINYLYEKCKQLESLSIRFDNNNTSSLIVKDFNNLKILKSCCINSIEIKDMNELEDLFIVSNRDIKVHDLPKLNKLEMTCYKQCKLYNLPSLSNIVMNFNIDIVSNEQLHLDTLTIKYINKLDDTYEYNPIVFDKVNEVRLKHSEYFSIYNQLLKYIPTLKKLYIKVNEDRINESYVFVNYEHLEELELVVRVSQHTNITQRCKLILFNIPKLRKVTILHKYIDSTSKYVEDHKHIKIDGVKCFNCNNTYTLITNKDIV